MTTVNPESFVPWCETLTRDTYNLTCYYLLLIIWTGIICLATFGIYKVSKTKQAGILPIFKYIYIVINLLFAAAPPGYAFGIYAAWNCSFGSDFSGFQSWMGLYMISLNGNFYGLAFLYLFFLLRLHLTFEDSTHELNKYAFYILLSGFVIQLILPIPSTYYFLRRWNETDRVWALRFFNAFVYTNLLCSSIVLLLFFKKIFSLTKQTRTRSHSRKITSSHSATQLENRKDDGKHKQSVQNKMHSARKDHNLLFLSMRYMILALFSMISTNLTSVYGFFRSELPSIRDNPHVINSHLVLNMFDCFVNLICIYLQWSFGQKLFDKYCHCVDICCQNCFIKLLGLDKDENLEPHIKENTKTHSKEHDQSKHSEKVDGISIELEIPP